MESRKCNSTKSVLSLVLSKQDVLMFVGVLRAFIAWCTSVFLKDCKYSCIPRRLKVLITNFATFCVCCDACNREDVTADITDAEEEEDDGEGTDIGKAGFGGCDDGECAINSIQT